MSLAALETSAAPLPTKITAAADRSFWIRLLTTTFLGAFLLFQVQPLIGKVVLPWYGGTPAVWTTTLLFFQLMLVAGYALAYLSVTFLSPTLRSYTYLALALGAVLLLPIGADARWKPTAADEPIAHMLRLLLACVGGPYLVLASTAPTTQEWFTRSGTQRSPYRLYALSNLGSLLGLLTYPFLVERYCDAAMQAKLWSGAFALFAAVAASCAWSVRGKTNDATTIEPDPARNPEARAAEQRISLGRAASWIGLAAAGTVLLMSATYHLCQDIASVPFLWVAPLVAYLLTFIIAFEHARWYRRTWYCVASVVLVPLACLQGVTFTALQRSKVWAAAYLLSLRDVSFGVQAAIVLGMLFATCMLCHGELAARKPSPRRLTLYFLAIAVGGALGGIFTAVVAPLIFDRNWEWMLATLAALGFALAGIYGELRRRKLLETFIYRVGAGAVGFAGIALVCWLHLMLFNENELVSARNFYGVVSVDLGRESETDRPIYKSMRSGTTFHGLQLTDEPFRRHATAYYSRESGVGIALGAAGENTYPLHVGVIGLGAGTLGVYGRPGDKYDFFEINPVVIRFADEHFSFLRDSAAQCRVVEGDARLSLEREAGDAIKHDVSNQYDILVLDAFSGDSIPTHLLTVEAFELYLSRLADDGLIAVHLSNRYLDLVPVVAAAAKKLGLAGMWSVNKPDPATYVQPARWALLTRTPNSPTWTTLKQLGFTDLAKSREVRLWTDGYSNLFEILK